MKNKFEFSSENIAVSYLSETDSFDSLIGDHCHDRYEITYLVSASGRYMIEGSEHKVTNGSLCFITPMSYHKVYLDTASQCEAYTLYFTKSALSDTVATMLASITDKSESYGRFYSREHISDSLISCFERFEVLEKLSLPQREAYMQAILQEIIILLSAAEGEEITSAEGELGARVARYLNSNFKKNISLDKLARRFFVSKYYLCRAFKSYSGISVHAYINHKRITYAKSLIESGVTASGAADQVGFGDYSAFYRAYVKLVGKSPTSD